ncbi:hypothetical protein BJF90_03930 [Pseudonocardia sp. CNS-004]|nr:hypothetical protein BJF90_03930 [Pseudonocardia sp. CNS-004]
MNVVSLTNVWVQTHADGLVRADQVIGIEAHTTAGLRDTQSHWLLDVVLATSVGSGFREGWNVTALHRTLAQTAVAPQGAAAALAELLARLDVMSAAGVIDVVRDAPGRTAPARTRTGSARARVASGSGSSRSAHLQPTVAPTPSTSEVAAMRVAVVGAGVVGLSATAALLELGAEVVCFEQAGAPMAARSVGSSRIFRLAHREPALVRRAAEARAGSTGGPSGRAGR